MNQRPNILQIIWHDLGSHLSCYGAGSVRTPFMDGMAAQGTLFANHFSTGAVCVPSRCSILTGRYPHAHALWRFGPAETALPAALRRTGYETCRFGFREELEFFPLGQDVDMDAYARNVLGYDRTRDDLRDTDGILDAVRELLVNRDSDAPLYCCAQLLDIHRPNEDPVDARRLSRTTVPRALPTLPDTPASLTDVASFEQRIERADAAVGRLLAALRAAGLMENTLVLLTADHGLDLPRAKMTLYDAGTRVAMIAWGCGVPAGLRDGGLHSHMDIFPTLLDFAGIPIPPSVQGVSFAAALRGEDETQSREFVITERSWEAPLNPGRAIRTRRWKYIRSYCPGRPIPIPPDYVRKVGAALTEPLYGGPVPYEQLYDLDGDPHELTDLASHPEHAAVLRALSDRLDAELAADRDPVLRTADYLPFLRLRLPELF